MENKSVRIVKRNLTDFPIILAGILLCLILFVPLASSFKDGAYVWVYHICWICFIVLMIVFACLAVLFVSSANGLLKEGNVIWATVDLDMLHYDDAILSVYCYLPRGERRIYYKGTTAPSNRKWAKEAKDLLTKEGIVPMIVDPEDPERYIVLVKDIVAMYSDGKKKGYGMDVIRRITWPETNRENGKEKLIY